MKVSNEEKRAIRVCHAAGCLGALVVGVIGAATMDLTQAMTGFALAGMVADSAARNERR